MTTSADAPARRARIFVVDDNSAMLTLYGRIMTLEGHDPVLFNAPMPALTAIAAKMQIDLLVTDMDLGASMTGLDLAREARAACPGLPVVIVTGEENVPDSPDVAARLGKPFRVQELAAALTRCLTP